MLHPYRYSFVVPVVFAECSGLPVPGFAVTLVAGALAANLHFHLPVIFPIATLAALGAESIGYSLGRSRGRPIPRQRCFLSLPLDSCVSRTEGLSHRNRLKPLLVSKFVPALNIVATPLAGMLKISGPRFVAADAAGITQWAGSAIALRLGFRS